MRKLSLTLSMMLMTLLIQQTAWSQCTPANCLSTLPSYGGICDTLLMDGAVNQAYSDFESFHTTTACFDAGIIDPTQAGTTITIDLIDNFTFSGLPAGLIASTNQPSYSSPANGCISVSGTPTEAGVFAATANFEADVRAYISCPGFPLISLNDNAADYALQLVILPDPSFSIPSSSFSSCDAAVMLTATGTTGGTFSGPGVSGNMFDPAVAGAGTHTISYVVSAQEGAAIAPAVDSSSITVTVSNFALSSSTSNSTCTGGDGSATITPSGGAAPYNFSWSNGASTATANNLTAGDYFVTVTDASGCSSVDTVTVTANSITIAGTTTTTNAGCGLSDGSATVTANNGTPPYSYNWNPSGQNTQTANNLAAGIYNVTVTDANGCEGILNATVNNPNSPTASISAQTNIACNGANTGDASVSPAGGTAPYNFSWSSGGTAATETGLGAGVYDVTVTDNASCIATASVTITEPSALTSTVDGNTSDVSCNGGADGSAGVTAAGGTPPYSYTWSNNASTATITGLVAGTYDLTISDANACVSTESVSIAEPTALAASLTATDLTCNGAADGTASSTVSGGTAPYSYSWSNGLTTADATGLAAGNYDLTVTDANGCIFATSTVTVSEPTAISSGVTTTDASSAGGTDGTVDIAPAGGTPPYTFIWSSGEITEDLAAVAAGTYTVTITDANGCTHVASGTVLDGPSSINYSNAGVKIAIYPNPTDGQTVLSLDANLAIDAQVQLSNVMGQLLQTIELNAITQNRQVLDLSAYPNGVYFVRIAIGEDIIVERIVKR